MSDPASHPGSAPPGWVFGRDASEPDVSSAIALEVHGLSVRFDRPDAAPVEAVRSVGFDLRRGEVLAIVGESGSGKSALVRSLLGLNRRDPGIVSGDIRFRFRDGTQLRPLRGMQQGLRLGPQGAPAASWRAEVDRRYATIRDQVAGHVLQNSRAALDPRQNVGVQLQVALRQRRPNLSAEQVQAQPIELLRQLGSSRPRELMLKYPRELTGALAQRVMLAMALVGDPELLFLDEVTAGLDAGLQSEILAVLRARRAYGFTGVLVTHDIGMVQALSDRVMVMRRGRAVRRLHTRALRAGQATLDPYSRQLLAVSDEP